MKREHILKILVLILTVVLISLISFVGIYKYDKGKMVNIMPDYALGKDMKGSRLVIFKVDDSTETVNQEEKTSDTSDETTKNETEEEKEETKTEEKPVNPEEILTKENYLLSKKIIENRIKEQKVGEYDLRLNEADGTIVLNIEETNDTDEIISFLIEPGEFEIIGTDTEEILLDKKDLKNVEVMYYGQTSGTTTYLVMSFNKEGAKKLEDITKEYIETTDEEGNSNKKTITIKIDGQTLLKTYFGETISSGQIQIPYGDPTTDIETVKEYAKSATYISQLLNNETIPIKYKIDQNQFVSADIDTKDLKNIITISIIIMIIVILYFIIKYKKNGIISGIAFAGLMALLFLMIRLTNIELSYACFAGIALSFIIECVLLERVLKQVGNGRKKISEELIKMFLLQVPLYIIALISSLVSYLPIVNFGTTVFWGSVLSTLLNWILSFVFLKVDDDRKVKENEE